MQKIARTVALTMVICACAVDPNAGGGMFSTHAMSTDMRIVESHNPTGVIKSKVVNGTAGKVVGFFVQPTDDNAARYTITIVSQKPLQTDLVDRDWEPSVWADFKQALTR